MAAMSLHWNVLVIDLAQAPPLLSQELSETDRFDMVCAQNAGMKEGEEKDLIKESEKLSLGQVKRRKKKPWKLMVRPKMRTGTI